LSTVQRLLPAEQRSAPWVQSFEQLRPASAHVCLYLGFKGDIRTAGASAANQWFYDVWDSEDDAWRVAAAGEVQNAPVLYVSFPSLKDPLHTAEAQHTGEVVTFVPWEVFAPWKDRRWRRRGEEYEAFKRRLQERLLAQLLEKMPGLKGMVDYAELSTPVTTEHFVRPSAGSIYGIEPTPARFGNPWLKPQTPIEGLYFAGSDVASVGVVGALMGGALAAVAAEPWAAMKFLRREVL
jgi:all-trans-retinol 13,14-reductase